MRERTPQDVSWNQQKELNAEHNRLLANNVLYHGQFWRRTITASKALRAIMKLTEKTTPQIEKGF